MLKRWSKAKWRSWKNKNKIIFEKVVGLGSSILLGIKKQKYPRIVFDFPIFSYFGNFCFM